MIEVGSLVRVSAPFDEAWPGVWEATGLSETGAWQIADGVDFDEIHLQEVVE